MIRNSAKAVIIKDGKVLLTQNIDEEGLFYLFPGGGQEKGETLHEAVVRECIEELGEQAAQPGPVVRHPGTQRPPRPRPALVLTPSAEPPRAAKCGGTVPPARARDR